MKQRWRLLEKILFTIGSRILKSILVLLDCRAVILLYSFVTIKEKKKTNISTVTSEKCKMRMDAIPNLKAILFQKSVWQQVSLNSWQTILKNAYKQGVCSWIAHRSLHHLQDGRNRYLWWGKGGTVKVSKQETSLKHSKMELELI